MADSGRLATVRPFAHSSSAGRRAALKGAQLIDLSEHVELYQRPELDIVSYFPVVEPAALTGIDAACARILADGMTSSDPVFLSTLKADREAFIARHPQVAADADGARILRSVLMMPESEHHVACLNGRVEQLAQAR